jgi:hypothetical protein
MYSSTIKIAFEILISITVDFQLLVIKFLTTDITVNMVQK